MAKANIIRPDGTKVNIEGSAEEVAVLLGKLSIQDTEGSSGGGKKKRKKRGRSTGGKTAKKQEGPTSLILELAEKGYFKSRRTMKEIQKKMEELGHVYAQTSISAPLLNLTKKRKIRRLKEKKGWIYVK